MKLYLNIFFILMFTHHFCYGQDFRSAEDKESFIFGQLNNEITELNIAKNLLSSGQRKKAIDKLCDYFSEKLSSRFYFNWKNFINRMPEYTSYSVSSQQEHKRRASEMMELYYADNDWNLPMKSKSGNNISAYQLRHLARQHKAIDVTFTYLFEKENEAYMTYIMEMVKSLEKAYINDSFEKKGNGVFESFRAGYRVYNWLFVFNALCSSSKFNSEYKFQFIKTFYYHAVELQKATNKFRYGNHHTKGLVALAMLSILFPEFNESKTWFNQSIELLTEHLKKEINKDGFQFERSIHYHVGDIDNYFYVYYLAIINDLKLPDEFKNTLYKMFEALTKLAYPNRTLPVLQDDTDSPWAEYNNLEHVMSLGSILFDDETFRYFSSDEVSPTKYWFVSNSDKEKLRLMKSKMPQILSASLPATGYYSMRDGWNKDDIVITITAGLSEHKPDHQHGDMLGMQLYAYENYMLPNYQVRYYLDEYRHFKNSFVKNICVADSIPQGREWKGNSGGSGFGKFLSLPEPKVETFYTSKIADVFVGSINYTESDYQRKVIFVKDGFIIVKDMLSSNKPKRYQQIWQGFYSKENEAHFRATFSDGSGLDILQLNSFNEFNISPIKRGKSSILFSSDKVEKHEFVTLLYPYSQFETRLDERKALDKSDLLGWSYVEDKVNIEGHLIAANKLFINNKQILALSISKIDDFYFNDSSLDVLINLDGYTITLLNNKEIELSNNTLHIKVKPFIEQSIEGIKK